MRQALLYYNPVAGPQEISPPRLGKIRELLFAHGIHCELVQSKPRSEGPPQLELDGIDLLLAMGGDGTIHQLLPVAAKSGITLGILPTGTANVLALELGIPSQLERAIRLLRAGNTLPMALGKADDEYFHLMAGIGIDGEVIRGTTVQLKRRFGEIAYWYAGFRTYFEMQPAAFRLAIDGSEHEATFAVISNCRFYGGRLEITPEGSPFSDHFDVCLFRGRKRSDFSRFLLGILRHRHGRFADVEILSCKSVELVAPEKVPVQLDGDLAMNPRPGRFTIQEKAVKVLVGNPSKALPRTG